MSNATTVNQALRKLPSVDAALKLDGLDVLIEQHGRALVIDAIRLTLTNLREQILVEATISPTSAQLSQTIAQTIQAFIAPTLEPVINATGVIIHTNLGRVLLSERAKAAMQEVASSYSNLEYDLDAGKRGSRYRHAEDLLCRLTGAEAAVVVNNNAAALILCLSTIATGKEVLINRSQLVEIGGGFRIPDIMAQSGAKLTEVGTTNRSYIADYEARIDSEKTGAILQVHQSNFKLIGFTTEPRLSELVDLGKRYQVPVMNDLGSGTLLDTQTFGLDHEPTIQESIQAGVSLVTASGDKLLGGPQAGLILGQADMIARLKKHPLIRAMRVDKITLAALQATLLAYVEDKALGEIPVWQMIAATSADLQQRVQYWSQALTQTGLQATIVTTASTVGGGSLPGQTLPTLALAISSPMPQTLANKLRQATPRVIVRIEDNRLILDPRTVLPWQDDGLLQALKTVLPEREQSGRVAKSQSPCIMASPG